MVDGYAVRWRPSELGPTRWTSLSEPLTRVRGRLHDGRHHGLADDYRRHSRHRPRSRLLLAGRERQRGLRALRPAPQAGRQDGLQRERLRLLAASRCRRPRGPRPVPGRAEAAMHPPRPPSNQRVEARLSAVARMRATSGGVAATGMPARCRAAFLSAAVPDDPSTIAPAWPIRLPGGALKPAM
jgi:hypothetical protein